MTGHVLVTGATGGLGRVLTGLLLAEGRPVLATGRNRRIGAELAAQGARFVAADLAQSDLAPLVEGAQTVFHLAALSAPWGPESAFEAANTLATTRLLAAARAGGCRRFVFASTPSIYTRPADQIGLDEQSPLPARFANAYARTKHAAERAVLAAADNDFAAAALRPRAIIGPHDTVLLPRLLRAAERGVLPLPDGGRALIEPSDARDVARAFIACEARAEAVCGRAFNISGGTAIAVRDLAAHVFARLGRRVRIIGLPRRVALRGAGLAELAAHAVPGKPEPFITRYGATVLGWSQTFDLTAAREGLGWTPRHHPYAAVDWALSEAHDA